MVVVNEELTAEEWKRRFEREREKVARLRQQICSMEMELKRWRSGGQVPEAEWASLISPESATNSLQDNSENTQLIAILIFCPVTPSSMTDSIFAIPERPAQQPLLSSRVGPISDDERRKYEEERSKLYAQLDEKDDEIQVQSQLAERLKQQLMEQVGLTQSMF